MNTSGKEKWISKIHLQNFTPVDLNLGKDTSVFVISAPQAAVARLLQKSKSTICAVPTNLQAAVTNNTYAIMLHGFIILCNRSISTSCCRKINDD